MSKLTVGQVLQQVDSLLPNDCDTAQKLAWLQAAEGFIAAEITLGAAPDALTEDTVLTAPVPYQELYRHYVEAQLHYINAETERFNNAMALWNTLFLGYQNYYRRNGSGEGGATALKLC